MKQIAVLVKETSKNTFEKIKEIKYKVSDKTFEYEKKTYPLPTQPVSTFKTNKATYIFYEVGNDEVIAFRQIDLGIDTKMLWRLINQGVFGQLVSKIRMDMQEQPEKWKILTTAIIFAVGCLIGYLVGNGGISF